MMNDLEIPDFLKSENRPKPVKPRMIKDKWVMPPPRETKTKRRQKKESHDIMVLAAVKNGADTFGKIRKELGDEIAKNEISNSLRRNIKSRRIEQTGRRYYPAGNGRSK
jgi:predicted HTH transcriptional regulator